MHKNDNSDRKNSSFRHQQKRPKKNTLIYGKQAVLRAIAEGTPIDKIFLQLTEGANQYKDIRDAAAQVGIPVSRVPVQKLNSFNIYNHDGVVALKSKIQYQDLQNVIDWVTEQGLIPFFVMLDGVTDVRNIGAIVRSAHCFGAQALIIPGKGVGALNEDAIQASAGALEQVQVCRVADLQEALDLLHLNGIASYVSDVNFAKTVMNEVDFTLPCNVILGSEDKGAQKTIIHHADAVFKIPMYANFDSLNVSVAAGIVFNTLFTQRS